MQWLTNLAAVVVRPRQTMDRILDAPRDRMVVPLVLLAALSGFVSDLSVADATEAWSRADPKLRMLVPLGVVVGMLAMLLAFYVASWLAYGIGRALEGTGTVRRVRSALAWGLAPSVWALLYRIPAMWVRERGDSDLFRIGDVQIALDPSRLAGGCGTGVLDLIVFAVWIAVTSFTLAEAHRFSVARGFGTIAFCFLTPLVIAAAAVLATR